MFLMFLTMGMVTTLVAVMARAEAPGAPAPVQKRDVRIRLRK